MRRLLLLIALACAPAFAQVGGNCYGTTSCTLSGTPPATALQIVVQRRASSTTPPGNPTGWTSVATWNSGTGGTTEGWRASCRVSSTTAVSGGTNAAHLAAWWYPSTGAYNTTNCATTGILQYATDTGKSNSANYKTVNPLKAAYGSMITAALANSGASFCTPTGMTIIGSPSGNIEVLDTVAPATTWPSTACSVTSETWGSIVFEIAMSQSGRSGSNNNVVQVDFYIDMQGNPSVADDTTNVCVTAGACTPVNNGTHSSQAIAWTASGTFNAGDMMVSRMNPCPRNYDYYVRGDTYYAASRPWRSIRIEHGAASGGATFALASLDITATPVHQITITGCLQIGVQFCNTEALADLVQISTHFTGRNSTLQVDCKPTTPALSFPIIWIESQLTGATTHSSYMRLTPGAQYRFSYSVDTTAALHRAIIWDPTSLAIVGEISFQESGTPEPIATFRIGQGEGYTNADCTGCQGHTYTYLEDIAVDLQGAYPIGPGFNASVWAKVAAAAGTRKRVSVARE